MKLVISVKLITYVDCTCYAYCAINYHTQRDVCMYLSASSRGGLCHHWSRQYHRVSRSVYIRFVCQGLRIFVLCGSKTLFYYNFLPSRFLSFHSVSLSPWGIISFTSAFLCVVPSTMCSQYKWFYVEIRYKRRFGRCVYRLGYIAAVYKVSMNCSTEWVSSFDITFTRKLSIPAIPVGNQMLSLLYNTCLLLALRDRIGD